MNLTPRQIAAYLEFNEKIDRVERANAFERAAVAAQGDGKTIEKMRKAIIGTG